MKRSKGLVRISAQLIRTSTETHLWVKTYKQDMGSVIALQEEVAGAVASEIRIKLLPAEKTRLTTARTRRPDAYTAYLQRLYHRYKRDQADRAERIVSFRRGSQIDQDCALA